MSDIKGIAVVICREVNMETGEISKYVVLRQKAAEVKGDMLFYFKMRAMFNPRLKYFITMLDESLSDVEDDSIISCMETSPEKFMNL